MVSNILSFIIPYIRSLIVLGLIVATSFIFQVVNNANRSYRILKIKFDEHIPLIPVFIYPYISFLLFIPVSLMVIVKVRPDLFLPVIITFTIAGIICTLFFYFFQTYIEKPEIEAIFHAHKLLKKVQDAVEPYNCFPSSHVLYTVLTAFFLVTVFPALFIFVNIYTFLVCASTVFVKQHYILDIFGGLALAALMYFTVIKLV